MTWYFNFCAPSMPNDATINFHRGFQTAELMALMILFVLYHTYYKLWGPDPLSETEEQNASSENESKQSSDQSKISSPESQSKSEHEQSKSDDDKGSVSIAQQIQNLGQQNQSYVSFKRSGEKFLKKKTIAETQTTKGVTHINMKQNVTVEQIESFFPIVFGHHAIAMGASIMYSPYAEQSIASVLYVLFCFLLAMVNSKRMKRSTYAVWIFMAFLNIFIMMSALLEVGQSNWDFVNNVCFAEQYVSLY